MTGGSAWDEAYQHDRAPWEIGRPQPAILRLADAGDLVEPILDSGCGSGEHALLAATQGLEVTGVDVSQAAIERARGKARQRGLSAEFLVGDVLALDHVERLRPPFRTVIDSGCFHTFDDADRPRYVTSLASVLEPGGVVHLLCFSELTPGTEGPRRVTQAEIRASFGDGWAVDRIDAETFAVSGLWMGVQPSAWLARIVRR
jgi:cyclopropane fatty-acyl-phospholipid synthase-like methyltransferase